ncbi:MAG: nitrophenyl compound nitroreductase subunit ArsF family protein [Thermoguttaceae bacterium]
MTITSFIRVSRPIACMAFAAIALFAMHQSARTIAAENTAASPSHQVIACYFHRTVRCNTCKKISAYIDEAVRTGFATQVKEGGVKMVMVDFQDEKNKKLTQAYKITGPTLVIMDVHDGEATAWKPAPKVWSLVGKKDDFFKYVQTEIQNYIDGKKPQSDSPAK